MRRRRPVTQEMGASSFYAPRAIFLSAGKRTCAPGQAKRGVPIPDKAPPFRDDGSGDQYPTGRASVTKGWYW